MINSCKVAGHTAAHAIWNVSDLNGEPFVPMLAYEDENGERKMERLVLDGYLDAAVAEGRRRLQANPMDANDAVLCYDGRISLETGKYDAVFVEARSYFSPDSRFTMAIPYSTSPSFSVHRPKVVQMKNCDDFELNDMINAFWAGVDAHEQGVAIWNAHMDESV